MYHATTEPRQLVCGCNKKWMSQCWSHCLTLRWSAISFALFLVHKTFIFINVLTQDFRGKPWELLQERKLDALFLREASAGGLGNCWKAGSLLKRNKGGKRNNTSETRVGVASNLTLVSKEVKDYSAVSNIQRKRTVWAIQSTLSFPLHSFHKKWLKENFTVLIIIGSSTCHKASITGMKRTSA